jgi:hypothetical protein
VLWRIERRDGKFKEYILIAEVTQLCQFDVGEAQGELDLMPDVPAPRLVLE